MKHVLIACIILLAVLAFCIFSMLCVRAAAARTLEALALSYQSARNHNFSAAALALSDAERSWNQHEDFFSSVLAHDEVDRVAGDLAELRQYVLVGDYDDYLAVVSGLMETLRHMRQVELPVYYNIF